MKDTQRIVDATIVTLLFLTCMLRDALLSNWFSLQVTRWEQFITQHMPYVRTVRLLMSKQVDAVRLRVCLYQDQSAMTGLMLDIQGMHTNTLCMHFSSNKHQDFSKVYVI